MAAGRHSRSHNNAQNVHGVGELTGSDYRLVGFYNEVSNGSADGQYEYTITFMSRLMRDGKLVAGIRQYFHAAWNADGELVAEPWGAWEEIAGC